MVVCDRGLVRRSRLGTCGICHSWYVRFVGIRVFIISMYCPCALCWVVAVEGQ